MIRDVTLADVLDLQKINAEELGYTISLEQTKVQLEHILTDETHHYLIGFEDDLSKKLVGYVHAEKYDTLYSETMLNILGLAVATPFQRQNIGRRLMEELEKIAKENNITSIRLNSGSMRHQAHLFYESLGYDGRKSQKRFIKSIQ